MTESVLTTWTIYERPADFPDVPFVLRGWIVGPGGQLRESGTLGFADTLEQARTYVPEGLTRFPRADDDDPVIVETWL